MASSSAISTESSEDQERPNEDQESIVVCTSLGTSGCPSSMPGLIGSGTTMSCNLENLSGTLTDVEVDLMEDEFLHDLRDDEFLCFYIDSMEMMALTTPVCER